MPKKVTVTAKVQLKVTPEQATLLDATMESYRRACNFISSYIFRTHELESRKLHDALYRPVRERFGLKAQVSASAIRNVAAKYKSIESNKHKWQKARFRSGQYELVWNRDYSLSGDIFSVNTLEKRIKVPFQRKGMEKYFDKSVYKFGTAILVKHGKKYFLHISVSRTEDTVTKNDIAHVVGIDRGINNLVTTYDSQKTRFVDGGGLKERLAHFDEVKSSLRRRQTPSARRRLKAIVLRENRWMRDVNHCVSKALVEGNPSHTLFVLEDVWYKALSGVVKRRDRYIRVQWAFGDLVQKLRYKAAMHSDMVVTVNPKYTSERCPKCGHTVKENRDADNHTFRCQGCGYRSNDDRIAAINLYQLGLKWLEDGTLAFRHDRNARGEVSRPTV